jgi:DNA topoisomerase I
VAGKSVTGKSLVIVESPAKAKTIGAFLGPDFIVESSIGHIRDLPKNASDVPPQFKKHTWARLGVDVDNDFRPLYVVDGGKREHIKRLKSLLEQVDQLYLATDEDREGESIAWHLLEVLQPKVPVKRMAFHEITRKAILEAIEHPREIDQRLVNAQEARRILDRLYGYEVSPVLWKKVMPKLSAGRVQSVSTRMVVARELERIRFVAASYWDIEGSFSTADGVEFSAQLLSVAGKRVALGKDFGDDGVLSRKDVVVLDRARAEQLAARLLSQPFVVRSVEQKPNRRSPAPPFMTSTLQQEASRKLRFGSARTMRAAQDLYEAGYITYMRTDSTTLSDSALTAARQLIGELYGAEYVPASPRRYANKVKNAQEAHEAIRPAGDQFRHPSTVATALGGDCGRLYELIWKRTVASQMEDSRGLSVKLSLEGKAGDEVCEFAVTGNTILFPGFLRAYVEGSDDPDQELEQRERPLPKVDPGQALSGQAFEPKGHETQPPARYTEAALVKHLEDLGVGRPSTYASIISTIQQRGYVWKKGTALVPSFKAFAVVQLLEQHFPDLVDYAFTAKMEDELDGIAGGKEQAVPWLRRFYFGGENDNAAPIARAAGSDVTPVRGTGLRAAASPGSSQGSGGLTLAVGLRSLVAERLGQIDARAINSLSLGKDDKGSEVVIRVGRYGPYLQHDEATAAIPEDLPPDELTIKRALELLQAPSGDRLLGNDPSSAQPVYVRTGRFGPYVQLGEAGGKEKPRTGSLLRSMVPAEMTLEDALKVLALPRTVGTDPSTNEPITAQLGRYGPYLARGKESRSLEREEQVFDVTLDHALTLFAQPKTRGRRKEAEPIKTLGTDDISGGAITLREGRFGLYVTDGETNASLRKGDTLESIDQERARELLQQRREREPVAKKKKVGKRSGAAAKSTGAKKGARKAAAALDGDDDASLGDDTFDGGDEDGGADDDGEPQAAPRKKKVAASARSKKKAAGKTAASKAPAAKSGVAKSPAAKSPAAKSPAGKSPAAKTSAKASVSKAPTRRSVAPEPAP